MSWVFKKAYSDTIRGEVPYDTYEVGFYRPNLVSKNDDPEFTLIKEFDNFEDAANLVHYLNGGSLSVANHLYKIEEKFYG